MHINKFGDYLGRMLHGVWLGGRVVRMRVRILVSPLSSAALGKLLTHICLCHQAV